MVSWGKKSTSGFKSIFSNIINTGSFLFAVRLKKRVYWAFMVTIAIQTQLGRTWIPKNHKCIQLSGFSLGFLYILVTLVQIYNPQSINNRHSSLLTKINSKELKQTMFLRKFPLITCEDRTLNFRLVSNTSCIDG